MGHTFVIGEAGISHDGDLRKAIDLIDAAKVAGVDAVKFQAFQAEKLAIARGKPELATTLKKYEMPYAWLPILKDHADKVGLEFMATCYYEEALPFVAPLVKRFKIGHAESQNEAFIEAHKKYEKEVIISTAVAEPTYEPFKWLYCTPQYPTPWDRLYLERIRVGDCDGFSDHSKCEMAGGLAVAAGAKIIEAHFKHNKTSIDNPDCSVAHYPCNLRAYVEGVRLAEQAMYGPSASQGSPVQPAP